MRARCAVARRGINPTQLWIDRRIDFVYVSLPSALCTPLFHLQLEKEKTARERDRDERTRGEVSHRRIPRPRTRPAHSAPCPSSGRSGLTRVLHPDRGRSWAHAHASTGTEIDGESERVAELERKLAFASNGEQRLQRELLQMEEIHRKAKDKVRYVMVCLAAV